MACAAEVLRRKGRQVFSISPESTVFDALRGKFSHDTLVRDIMTPNPIAIYGETEIEECMRLMTDYQVRHLPVLEGNTVARVVSIGDVVKLIIETQRDFIADLERYIVER